MRIAAIICVLALVGCATTQTTVETKVPVPVPCKVQKQERPAMPVDNLIETDDIFAVVKALWATVEIQSGYASKLEAAVESCQ